MIITQVLCNRHTKTQTYVQCGTMSVKNLARRLGVHDKTDHTLEVRSLTLGEIIGRLIRVTLFCENAPTIWNQHSIGLKEHSNRVYLSPRPALQRVGQDFSLIIQVQPRKHFNTQTLSMNNTTHTTP